MKRLFQLALVFLLLLGLAGCGSGGSNSFTWKVSSLPDNLDPQLAQSSENVMAVTHLFSGLLRTGPDGTLQNECCQSYTVSADGLTYTFTLRPGLTYNGYQGAANSTPVTAADFVFGLQRVFLPETKSPYADSFSAIAGSEAVRAGGDAAQLGVSAPDDTTLIIRLSRPDSDLLQKLTLPGAMPCNQAFFESTHGAYGLSRKVFLGNGSFYLYNWNANGLFARRRGSGSQIDAVRIVLTADDDPDGLEMLTEGDVDAALYEGSDADRLGFGVLSYNTTTWSLVFQCSRRPLSCLPLRQALALSAQSCALNPDGGALADGLIPPDVSLGSTRYRSSVSAPVQLSGNAKSLYREGLAELGVSALSGSVAWVPAEEPYSSLFDTVNQQWQKELSFYCNVQRIPLADLTALVDGTASAALVKQYGSSWDIAFVPLSPEQDSPLSCMEPFLSGGFSGYDSAAFDTAYAALERQTLGSGQLPQVCALEELLLQDAPVVPLFFQEKNLLTAPGLSGLVFQPFGPVLDLTYATR